MQIYLPSTNQESATPADGKPGVFAMMILSPMSNGLGAKRKLNMSPSSRTSHRDLNATYRVPTMRIIPWN